MEAMQPPKKVLVVLSNMEFTHRQHLEGILRYARTNLQLKWEVLIDLNDTKIDPRHVHERGIDGIIAAVYNASDRQVYLDGDVPTVLYEPTRSAPVRAMTRENLVTFCNDHTAEGEAAADFFLSRGYTSFAFVGSVERTGWSDQRLDGYKARLKASGYILRAYPRSCRARDLALDADRLATWLKRLPPRTALLAANDKRALQVISAATHAGIAVPEDLVVLGVDNDELICSTASPSISSIRVSAVENGERFAEALAALFAGRKHERVIVVRNTTVVPRGSTDLFAYSDIFLSRALAYAASHLRQRPRLPDLAREARCSVRTLQARAQSILGHSLKEELTRLQLAAFRDLKSSDRTASADELARRCGFCHSSHLHLRLRTERFV